MLDSGCGAVPRKWANVPQLGGRLELLHGGSLHCRLVDRNLGLDVSLRHGGALASNRFGGGQPRLPIEQLLQNTRCLHAAPMVCAECHKLIASSIDQAQSLKNVQVGAQASTTPSVCSKPSSQLPHETAVDLLSPSDAYEC